MHNHLIALALYFSAHVQSKLLSHDHQRTPNVGVWGAYKHSLSPSSSHPTVVQQPQLATVQDSHRCHPRRCACVPAGR